MFKILIVKYYVYYECGVDGRCGKEILRWYFIFIKIYIKCEFLCFILGVENLEDSRVYISMLGILLIRKFFFLYLYFVGVRR